MRGRSCTTAWFRLRQRKIAVSVLETTLDLNQWFAFKPTLPADRLSNINYGQKNTDNSSTKVLALKGIGNGLSNILYFKRKENSGEWELYKFEDVSI